MASLLLSNEEVDALSWVELKRKCQESGIPTVGVGRTKAVLAKELKNYYYDKRATEEGVAATEGESSDGADEEDAPKSSDSTSERFS